MRYDLLLSSGGKSEAFRTMCVLSSYPFPHNERKKRSMSFPIIKYILFEIEFNLQMSLLFCYLKLNQYLNPGDSQDLPYFRTYQENWILIEIQGLSVLSDSLGNLLVWAGASLP